MLQRLFDELDEIGKATALIYIGAFFGGLYLVVQLVVGVDSIPDDFELTPAEYLAFLGVGGGALGIGNGILKGKRAEADAGSNADDLELERLHAQEETSNVGSAGPVTSRGEVGPVGPGEEFPASGQTPGV